MRLHYLIWLAGLSAILAVLPALAASASNQESVRTQLGLGDYEVVIADTGDLQAGWDGSPTHVYVKVLDAGAMRYMYFDNLPAAVFVLRELYGTPRIVQLYVADFPRSGQGSGGTEALINGLEAYYVWDHQRFSRGNLPLILAFSDYHAAVNELAYREGELLSYDNLVPALERWAQDNSSRIYWRGWDQPRWEKENWSQAWDDRWSGWSWDDHRGWGCDEVRLDHGHGHGPGHNRPGPGHHPGPGGGGNEPRPDPGPEPEPEPDFQYQHENGGAGTDEYTGGRDSNSDTINPGRDQDLRRPDTGQPVPPVREHDSNKPTPRVRDDAAKPGGGADRTDDTGKENTEEDDKNSGDKSTADKHTEDKNAGGKGSGDKDTGDKSAEDKGAGDKGGGKGSGRVK